MMATKQPIRMRVLLSSTLWVGSSSGGGKRRADVSVGCHQSSDDVASLEGQDVSSTVSTFLHVPVSIHEHSTQ